MAARMPTTAIAIHMVLFMIKDFVRLKKNDGLLLFRGSK